jgi:hypothetical protein
VSDHGVMTTSGIRQARAAAVERSVRDEALDRVLAKEEAIIEAERLAALEDAKPALIEAVQSAAAGVSFNDEIVQAQENVVDLYAKLNASLGALHAARKDDDRARRAYRRAVDAAVKAGVSQSELPDIPDAVTKMRDLAPGIGEGGWAGRQWSGGA